MSRRRKTQHRKRTVHEANVAYCHLCRLPILPDDPVSLIGDHTGTVAIAHRDCARQALDALDTGWRCA